jgi:hypothetical protein
MIDTPEAGPRTAEPPPAAQASISPEPPGFGQTLQALREELMLAVHERVHLVALEFRQVSLNAAQMVMLAMAAGLMLASAWATVLVATYKACTAYGLHWGLALLLVTVLNLVCAALVWLRAHALSHAFTLPATRRMLTRRPEPHQEE